MFRALIAEFQGVDPAEQVLPGAEEDRRDRKVQLVDQALPQVLLDRRDASADPHVLAACGLARPTQGGMDSIRDEVKRRTAFHLDRLPRMMREHEDRDMVRRTLAPPAFPRVVRPLA